MSRSPGLPQRFDARILLESLGTDPVMLNRRLETIGRDNGDAELARIKIDGGHGVCRSPVAVDDDLSGGADLELGGKPTGAIRRDSRG